MKINVLQPSVFNKISAGEVVERPASVVKELVENSIDAGATEIRIEIEGGGITNITISDNGHGIDKEDLVTAFLPHATSKIKNEKDLENILSLGFRGEALASISAVTKVRLSSKTKDNTAGYMIRVDGGQFSPITEIARSNGTTISCSNLFFNTPVRAKFLRKPKTEEAEITNVVERFMLANSHISFQYYVDGKQVYNTTSCSMQDIIYSIYGREVYDNLVEVLFEDNGFIVKGFITKPSVSKSNRTYQTLFVNGRNVENFLISSCISNVYSSYLMKGRFPVYVLSLQAPTDCVDVNVHPSKKEVKFENPNKIYSLVSRAVSSALNDVNEIQSFSPFKEEKTEFIIEEKVVLDKPEMEFVGGRSFCIDKFEEPNHVEEVDLSYNPQLAKREIIDMTKKLTQEDVQRLFGQNPTPSSPIKLEFDQSEAIFMRDIKKESAEKFLQASVKDEMKVLGTIFNTYIAVEYDDAVFFIDQHAAHERLLFDKLVKQINENEIATQSFLAPYSFKLGAKESQNFDMIIDDLKSMGFEIDKQGYVYSIKGVPYILANLDIAKFVEEITHEGVALERKTSDFIHNKLCQSACKHAIKGGDDISKEECAYIVEEVKKGVMLCPHGRPITLIITKTEFEKMFKRIV